MVERGTLGKGSVFEWIEDNVTTKDAGKITTLLRDYKRRMTGIKAMEDKGLAEIYVRHVKNNVSEMFRHDPRLVTSIHNVLTAQKRRYFPG